MIDPNNLIPIDNLNEEESIFINLSEIPICETQDYDLTDPKEFKKYMSDIERIVRNSFEYRRMVNYLREYMNMNRCSFMENVSNANDFGVKIHLHHSPFTLYDITNAVYLKRTATGESLEVEMVAKEILYLHYRLAVGLIPLSETVHDLVHNGYIFIPVQNVMGMYDMFYNEYLHYIPEETKDLYNRIIDFSEDFDTETQNKVFQKSYVYYNVEGQDNNIQEVIDQMGQRIDQIKSSNMNFYNAEDTKEFVNPILLVKPSDPI